MKKFLIILAIIIIAVVSVILYNRIQVKLKQQKQRPTSIVFNVNTIKAQKSLLKETISAQSIAEGNPQVKVYANNLTGILLRNTVKEGDYVTKDSNIAYIDRNVPGSDYAPAPVKSPINGVVTKLYYPDKGANITAAQPIAEIANINSIKIVVTLGEEDLLKIKQGQSVLITSDFVKDLHINARVDSLTPFINNDTFSGSIIINVDNRDRKLTIGMSVNVDIEIAQRMALVVPESTVLMGQDETYIFVNNNNVAKKVNVKTGYTKNGIIEIVGNIKDGDQIITDGNFKLNDGSQIQLLDSKGANRDNTKDSSNNKKANNPNYKKK